MGDYNPASIRCFERAHTSATAASRHQRSWAMKDAHDIKQIKIRSTAIIGLYWN
jgi:hypothetical protein